MENRDHLFKKGQSGNPNGRPKDTFSLVGMIKHKLKEVPEGEKETYADLLVKKYIHKALVEGNDKILRDLVDRVDGKAIQRLAGEDGPLEFLVRNLKDGDNSAL